MPAPATKAAAGNNKRKATAAPAAVVAPPSPKRQAVASSPAAPARPASPPKRAGSPGAVSKPAVKGLLIAIVQKGVINELKQLGSRPIQEVKKNKAPERKLKPKALKEEMLKEMKRLETVRPSSVAEKTGLAEAIHARLGMDIKRKAVVAEIKRKARAQRARALAKASSPRLQPSALKLNMAWSPQPRVAGAGRNTPSPIHLQETGRVSPSGRVSPTRAF